MYTLETREFYISPGVTCTCDLPIPDLSADPTQAPALGDSISEKNEKLDQFLSEILFPQYTSAIKMAIRNYRASALPEKYLYGHNVHVMPMPSSNPALYYWPSDMIFIDPDALSIGIKDTPGKFIYGHEFGHRIIHFSSHETVNLVLNAVCSILTISSQKLAEEILCDAFGSLISHNTSERFDSEIDPIKQEGIKLAALRLAWSC